MKSKKGTLVAAAACIAGLIAWSVGTSPTQAAEDNEDVIKEVMKTCHKAPKGEDPICKKAVDGKASAEELKKLISGYRALARAHPPNGDEASWKEKTGKLLTTAEALEKGEAGAAAKYKAALDCKACHSVHKPN